LPFPTAQGIEAEQKTPGLYVSGGNGFFVGADSPVSGALSAGNAPKLPKKPCGTGLQV
jgi:hypothetical protein